uniref:Mitochondrial ribosomal protein L55 n=1 Tax=Rattus norvegicus TaxID=10116 RepID=A0A8I5ZK26_RAT
MPLGSLLGLLRHCGVRAAFPAPCHLHTSPWRADCSRASLTRLRRQAYARLYPVLLVKQDGSTIHIRYREPRRMLAVQSLWFQDHIKLHMVAPSTHSTLEAEEDCCESRLSWPNEDSVFIQACVKGKGTEKHFPSKQNL